MSTATNQQKLEEYNKLQNELETQVINRQKLETQLQENLIVDTEFKNLKNDNSKIFKLTGNVLLPIDEEEAKINVEKRLEFIKDEIKKCEDKIANIRLNISKLQ